MLSADGAHALRRRFLEAGYILDAVLDRIGPAGNAGLGRNSTLAAEDALAGERDAQATLVRLLMLQRPVGAADARSALGPAWQACVDAGVLAPDVGREEGLVRATLEIRPYGADDWSGWICHDLNPGMDGRIEPVRPDFVLGVSPASTTLAQLTIRTPVARALDLGTGCGVQALHLARHADRVVATDLNPRALDLARLSLLLTGVDADLRLGSLYEPVGRDTFDLVVSNPPYVMSPPTGERLTYREGAYAGDELVRLVITGGGQRLADDGTLQVLANWAVTDQPWDERLAGWIAPTGCDALVIEREVLDPYEYVELWLNDAGLAGAPDHRRRSRDWLAYLAGLGVRGVGMGWFSLHRSGRSTPDLQFESWPHAVHQPVGEAFAAHQRGVALADRQDDELLATAWTVDPRIVQETLGRPGEPDPEHIILRQPYGLGRATTAGTGLAAVVGACDGQLAAGQIVDAVASLLDVDAAALRAEVAPELRRLVRDCYLT